MTIKKYLHSCLCIEENGKRLLIDPGAFSFVEGTLSPKDIGPVDVIIYTHTHADHLDIQSLKSFLAMKKATLVAHLDVGRELEKNGLLYERIEAGEKWEAEGFSIEAHAAPHDPIPSEIPHNLAYVINKTVLHPGDSLRVEGVKKIDVLALPTFAPWLRAVDAIAFAQKLSPKIAIPIHDAMMKDFFLERMYTGMFPPHFSNANIDFHPLSPTDELSV
ncbi:MBL fold metallo-hydrolase [Candidatus Uhrbacteria bacterium]|nr:MBL fold metallo-hydrolase [Candidatus Uhrbacteria bacterium]